MVVQDKDTGDAAVRSHECTSRHDSSYRPATQRKALPIRKRACVQTEAGSILTDTDTGHNDLAGVPHSLWSCQPECAE
jgi:hypothetical protein